MAHIGLYIMAYTKLLRYGWDLRGIFHSFHVTAAWVTQAERRWCNMFQTQCCIWPAELKSRKTREQARGERSLVCYLGGQYTEARVSVATSYR